MLSENTSADKDHRQVKILVATATYNEVGNVGELIEKIHKELGPANILVVDDGSPDGTGELLEKIKKSSPFLHIIHRKGKLGLGTAHRDIMLYAIEHKYDYLVTMDADLSHDPKHLSEMLDLLEAGNDFVTGSRYTRGGHSGQTFFRHLLSILANTMIKIFLGVKLKECTTSYRGMNVSVLKKIDFEEFSSDGYAFLVEFLFYFTRLTKKYCEFPINFQNRKTGESKIHPGEILESLRNLMRLFLKRSLQR